MASLHDVLPLLSSRAADDARVLGLGIDTDIDIYDWAAVGASSRGCRDACRDGVAHLHVDGESLTPMVGGAEAAFLAWIRSLRALKSLRVTLRYREDLHVLTRAVGARLTSLVVESAGADIPLLGAAPRLPALRSLSLVSGEDSHDEVPPGLSLLGGRLRALRLTGYRVTDGDARCVASLASRLESVRLVRCRGSLAGLRAGGVATLEDCESESESESDG